MIPKDEEYSPLPFIPIHCILKLVKLWKKKKKKSGRYVQDSRIQLPNDLQKKSY